MAWVGCARSDGCKSLHGWATALTAGSSERGRISRVLLPSCAAKSRRVSVLITFRGSELSNSKEDTIAKRRSRGGAVAAPELAAVHPVVGSEVHGGCPRAEDEAEYPVGVGAGVFHGEVGADAMSQENQLFQANGAVDRVHVGHGLRRAEVGPLFWTGGAAIAPAVVVDELNLPGQGVEPGVEDLVVPPRSRVIRDKR